MTEPISVVIVDDHVALRRGIELLLGRWGHVIAGSARDAAHAFEVVRRVRPDVVVIDLGLPGQDGADLTRRLLAYDPELAVLLYTGLEDRATLTGALDCGARGFALKSGSPEDLIKAIRALADGGSYVDPRLSAVIVGHEAAEHVHELSPREREMLDLLAQGLTGAEAARRLHLSPETVRTHIRNAMVKLRANTRVHAVALALRQHEISLDAESTASGGTPPFHGAPTS
jgi:DNA-binding NarL/FixJ family response regulator